MADTDAARWRANLQDEVDGALVYRAMAEGTDDARLSDLYGRLAAAEERHGALWRERLGGTVIRPSTRARILAFVARRFGAAAVAPVMAAEERQSRAMYDDQPEAAGTSLPDDERSHARLLRQVTGGVSGPMLARFEGRHRAIGGNALRAAVLGANDGLVSNFSLVMGVAGASAGGTPVLVAGLAGLLAGSLSMALGEWLSVQSARELHANQIATEADELEAFPEEEEEELRLIYEAKGATPDEARLLAARIIAGDRAVALDTMAREELGVDPNELGGSAWVAAVTSFVLFALGDPPGRPVPAHLRDGRHCHRRGAVRRRAVRHRRRDHPAHRPQPVDLRAAPGRLRPGSCGGHLRDWRTAGNRHQLAV